MRKLVSLLAVSFLFLCAAVAQPDYKDFYDEYSDSVVAVRVSNEDGSSVGSGFIYSGYVVTSNHVIVTSEGEPYPELELRSANTDNWVEAEVVGRNTEVDLAVLDSENMRIENNGLQVANSSPQPGQRVIVIGNSYGMESTITHGIVSGVNRTPVTDEGAVIENAIQIDAPVNPGDSGGPLMTENGTVLGVVNSRIGDNIGFAVHYTTLEDVFPELIS